MATDNSPSLAERIVTLFVKRADEWVAEQRLAMLVPILLVAVGYQSVRSVYERPENEFVSDLVFNTLLMVLFGLLLSISRMIRQLQGTGGFTDTAPGEFVLICMEAFLYLPLLVLYAYQTLQLCDTLYRQWEEQR